VLDRLAEGAVTLTTVGLLARHLTVDNAHSLLTAACHKSKREVEHLVAAIRPLPPVPSYVRKLPSWVASGVPSYSAAPAEGAAPGTLADEAVPPLRDVSEVPLAGPAVAGRPAPVHAAVTPLRLRSTRSVLAMLIHHEYWHAVNGSDERSTRAASTVFMKRHRTRESMESIQ
jgi:hypothetical protein